MRRPPYGEKIRALAANLSHAIAEYKHPSFVQARAGKIRSA